MADTKECEGKGRRWALHGLMLASGFAGLGYQMVWTQQSALWLCHESAAVLAVVAAFFGGLGLGAMGLGPLIERSQKPLRWYAGCEVVIAAWGLVLLVAMPQASGSLLSLTGVAPSPAWQWAVAFAGTLLLLLPATAAMGATLPALERGLAALNTGGRSIATLYAANTLGAVLGVLGSAFWLVPELGLARTSGICMALNLGCAAAALAVARGLRLAATTTASTPATVIRAGVGDAALSAADSGSIRSKAALRLALLKLGASGALGIGYEVAVVRVLSQVTEDTVYTFALLLAVYLAGTATGAAAYGKWSARKALSNVLNGSSTNPAAPTPDRALAPLLGALAAACLLGALSLWGAESVRHALAGLLGGEGSGMATALAIEATLAALAFGLPTLVMGALFSHLCGQARAAGASFGLAMGVNTLGASLAPLGFGVVLLPWLGPKAVLLLLALGYLALAFDQPNASRRLSLWAPLAATGALAALAPPLAFVDIPEGGRRVSYREGAMAAVSVVEDAEGVLRLRINNRQQEGSSATRLVDGRQALLPVLLHPAPRRALFLGLGTGITAATAAQVPGLEVDAVELLPEVAASAELFTAAFNGGQPNPRLHVVSADARRFVRASQTRYDVIVADNFHPARSGSGSLYTVEHFSSVKARLAEDGLFCQWLPLHQLDLDTLRSIVKSFMAVYPQGSAILASNSLETPVIGLVGRVDSARFSGLLLRDGLARAAWPEGPAAHGIEDEFALLGSWAAGPRALLAFAGQARANTDDLPVVAYQAPRITYAASSQPRERLLGLLQAWETATGGAGSPGETIDAGHDGAWGKRLEAYVEARNRFLEAGRNVRPSPDLHEMLAQVQAPLLAVLEASPDFRPAYTPLWRMAVALAKNDPETARALLQRLAALQPLRPEAAASLSELGTKGR